MKVKITGPGVINTIILSNAFNRSKETGGEFVLQTSNIIIPVQVADNKRVYL